MACAITTAAAYSYSTPDAILAARRAHLEKKCRFPNGVAAERAYKEEMEAAVKTALAGRKDILETMTRRLSAPPHTLASMPLVPSFKNDVDGDVIMAEPVSAPTAAPVAVPKYSEIFGHDTERRKVSMIACMEKTARPEDTLPFRTERAMLIAEILYNLKAAGQKTRHTYAVLWNISQRPSVSSREGTSPHTSECYMCHSVWRAADPTHIVSATRNKKKVQYELCTGCHHAFKGWYLICHWFSAVDKAMTMGKNFTLVSEKLCAATDAARRVVLEKFSPYVTTRLTYDAFIELGEFYNDPTYSQPMPPPKPAKAGEKRPKSSGADKSSKRPKIPTSSK